MKKILYLITLILAANLVFALGVVPSEKEALFEPNKEEIIQLKILNNEKTEFNAVVYAEGDLAEYITIRDSLIKFSKNEEYKIISYIIKFPDKIEKQGKHNTNIVIRALPKGSEGDTMISTNLAVISKLIVDVPYKGKYAEAKLFISNFQQGKESNFIAEVKNLGTEDILSAKAVIDIYGPLGNRLITLTSTPYSITSKEKKNIAVPWAPELGPGLYRAVLTLIYDELNTKDEKTFTIGEIYIDIDSISVENFKLGGIARFDILISNNWNMEIEEVYAEAYVKDEQKTYTKYKTATANMEPFGKQELQAYWDTNKVLPGKYVLDVALHYLDKTSEKAFEIFVDYNEIKTTPVGMAITSKSKETPEVMKWIYILVILVVILIIFNIFIYLKKIRKK